MGEIIIIGRVTFVTILALNGASVGVVAILHAWRSRPRRGGRVLLAGVTAGSLPSSLVIVVPLAEGAGEETVIWLLSFAVTLAFATAVSLPGALLVARKLAAPGEDYRAFE